MVKSNSAEQAALARLGAQVRARLDGDDAAYKVPVESADIYAISDFLLADECARFIPIIDSVAKPSTVYDLARPDENPVSPSRTSFSGDVDPQNSLVKMVERRLGDLLGIDLSWGENVQGQRYAPGQEFKGHYDWFDFSAAYGRLEMQRGGQRSFTAMVYLNDVEEGGETEFLNIGLSVPPQRGALLLWNNMRADGTPNPDTLHAGTPVLRGTKYIITKWFRTRPWG